MKSFFVILAAAGLLTAAHSAFTASQPVHYAGTDRFLRNDLAYTTEQLTEPFATEEREPFELATGETTITDPLGDVLNRLGQSSDMRAGWGDISSVSVKKEPTKREWHVTITVGEPPGNVPAAKTQYWILVDGDPEKDNEYAGVRINTDLSFMLKYSPEEARWGTDFRWYNAPVDFWALDRETASSFEIVRNEITYRIPFSELSGNVIPRWRVLAAVRGGAGTQIDVAPTVGFPPPKAEFVDETDADDANASNDTGQGSWLEWSAILKKLQPVHIILLVSTLAACAYALYSMRKK